jgi:hypothetical protein
MKSAAEEADERVSKRQRERWSECNGWKRKSGGTAKEYFSWRYYEPDNYESWYQAVADGLIQPVKKK